MIQQLYENHLSFDQVKVLNASCKNEKELLLNILLEEILVMNTVNKTIIIDDEMNRVFKY